MFELYPHQKDLLEQTAGRKKVGYFVDMGLGKTFLATEKMVEIGNELNCIICQKSKIDDWCQHIEEHYPEYTVYRVYHPAPMAEVLKIQAPKKIVCIINYELFFRRRKFIDYLYKRCTLILDESSLIQNENAKRTKAVLAVRADAVILLSGTVVNGNYEKLWSQCNLLGWSISRELFDHQYVEYRTIDSGGFQRKIPCGYKNVDRLKNKLRIYGGIFRKCEEVYDTMPETNFEIIRIPASKEYWKFDKDKIIPVEDRLLIGDMLLTERLYARMLCGQFSENKFEVVSDLLDSTDDRVIIFYWFQEEYNRLRTLVESKGRAVSTINGEEKDLEAYNNDPQSVTLCQYQAAAMGHNLQLANRMILFSLPDGNMELLEQCYKRIDRLGQTRPCFYYILLCQNTIEEKIWKQLGQKFDRVNKIFDNSESSH